MSGWTAFEKAAANALEVPTFGTRFWDKFDEKWRARNLDPPDRGSGLWQNVKNVHGLRNSYTHLTVPQAQLILPDATKAENAIETLRAGVQDLHVRLSLDPPIWVEDDVLPRAPGGSGGALLVGKGGIADDPDAIRICYVVGGQERTSTIWPPGTDPTPHLDQLIKDTFVALTAVRAYRGTELIEEVTVNMRGS